MRTWHCTGWYFITGSPSWIIYLLRNRQKNHFKGRTVWTIRYSFNLHATNLKSDSLAGMHATERNKAFEKGNRLLKNVSDYVRDHEESKECERTQRERPWMKKRNCQYLNYDCLYSSLGSRTEINISVESTEPAVDQTARLATHMLYNGKKMWKYASHSR